MTDGVAFLSAWVQVTEARPEYALLRLQEVPGWPYFKQPRCEARIEWWEGGDRKVESRYGETPTDALAALADALRGDA